jgi:hypothetical protein
MIERAAEAAKLGIEAHAHMLRHACGYALANKGIELCRFWIEADVEKLPAPQCGHDQ